MSRTYRDVLKDQGRGIAGALFVVGLAFLYTMESWWLGWRLPLSHLLVYAVVGLLVILAVTQQIGFQSEAAGRSRNSPRKVVVDFAELVFQSFFTAYLVLLAFGVVNLGHSFVSLARIGLIQVVPLGFGAAVANRLLTGAEEDIDEEAFPRNLPTYVFGAVFVAFPVAPTDEIEVIALQAGWARLAGVVVLSVVVAYLVLYELEFRGQNARIESRSRLTQLGSAFVVYAVGLSVAVAFLAAFGNFAGATLEEGIQQTIVLSFIASIGASAGEVVL